MTAAHGRRALAVAGLLGVALLLRVAVMDRGVVSYDDATVALVAKHYLSGEAFPAFFYRQAYMGALNGIHLVPALFLFGPSVLVVRLTAVAYSLLFPWLLYILGRRLFDEPTARIALLLAAVPPFLLTNWSTLAEPHFETNTFGAALLLLALVALAADPGSARYARTLGVFGLTAGLAWWTNFKAVEVMLPALLVLALRDPRLPRRRAGLLAAGGFLLGSLPVWLFYGMRAHEDAAARAAQLFEARPPLSLGRVGDLVATVVPALLGGYYWPADTWPRWAALAANISVYVVACLILSVEARHRARRAPPDARAWGLALLLAALIAPFALVTVSGFARRFDHETVRYVLPAYIPLFLAAAALVVRLGRSSRVLAAGLLAGLLAFNLWTQAGWLWPNAAERAMRAREVRAREGVRQHLAARPVRALYADQRFLSLEWAFYLWHLPVSDLTNEVYVPHALAADAAEAFAILAGQGPAQVRQQLDLLDATYRRTRYGGQVLFEEIRVPSRAYRLISRAAWRVPGDTSVPPAVADGDLATGWPPEATPTVEVVVDLGAPYPVGRLVWWPTTIAEETAAVAVAVSADGVGWEPVGTLPARRPAYVAGGRPFFRPRGGWLEVRFKPRRLRYLRFASASDDATTPWGVAELYAYADAGPRPVSDGPDARAVVAALDARGLRRLLADPAISARVAQSTRGTTRTLPANGFLDSHGRYLPPARLAVPVRLGAADGALVPEEDMDDLRMRLGEAGLAFREASLGDHRLVYGFDPLPPPTACRRTTWTVSGVLLESHGSARYAVHARLRDAQRLVGFHIEHPSVSTRAVAVLRLEVSEDGRTWRPVSGVRRLPEWRWAGRTLLRFSGDVEELLLPPTAAREARVEIRLPARGEGAITRVCASGEPLT